MAHVDCTFHLTDFQLDSPWGEEGVFFLILWGETLDLELYGLDVDDLNYMIEEIESGMRQSEDERKLHEVEELLYRPPEPAPNKLRFCFDGLGGLQALYQPPDRLWEMVFEDSEDNSQADIIMSTGQVEALLKQLKDEAGANAREENNGA